MLEESRSQFLREEALRAAAVHRRQHTCLLYEERTNVRDWERPPVQDWPAQLRPQAVAGSWRGQGGVVTGVPEVKTDSPETLPGNWLGHCGLPLPRGADTSASTETVTVQGRSGARPQGGAILMAFAGVRWHSSSLSCCSLTSPTCQLPEHSLTRSHGDEGLGVPTELVDLGQLLPTWIRRAISVYVEGLLAPPPMWVIQD